MIVKLEFLSIKKTKLTIDSAAVFRITNIKKNIGRRIDI